MKSSESDKYILMHKNIKVIEVRLDDNGMMTEFGEPIEYKHLPFGVGSKKTVDYKALKKWWKGRSIPINRKGLNEFLQSVGMVYPQELLKKSLGLSLSDQYWICPIAKHLLWEEVNFFDNNFSDDVGETMFRNSYIDENGCELKSNISLFSPDNTSDGMLRKKWKIINGKRCLVKEGSRINGQEPFNEVLATKVCERLGIPHIPYWILIKDGTVYSVCEDFITKDTELVPAWTIKQHIIKDNGVCNYENYIQKVEMLGILDVRRRIDQMLTLDFLIANTDRHYNNFGLIRDANTLDWLGVAPIYDSGTSMWCDEDTDMINFHEGDFISSKLFREKHINQIELIKDFSWLDLSKLDGIAEEFRDLLVMSGRNGQYYLARVNMLCFALKERISRLKRIVGLN